MRVFIAVLVLIFSLQSWTKADDIRDFEIEGMSIGDSLLDYFSETEIKNSIKHYYKNKKFTPVEIYDSKKYQMYDSVSFNYKTGDTAFKIQSLSGSINYPTNILDCYKKLDEIVKDLDVSIKSLQNITKIKKRTSTQTIVKPDDTKKTAVYFFMPTGDYIEVACYDYSKESKFMNNLSVSIRSKKIGDFLQVAYD